MRDPGHTLRLGRQVGEGVFCDTSGLWMGEVALLERTPEPDAPGFAPPGITQ